MKSSWKIIIVLILAIALVWWYFTRGEGAGPDKKLAKHFEDVCDIAGSNIDKPVRGVDRMFGYYGKHGPDMLKAFGDTLVAIERKGSDEDHDRRAREARDRMWAPLRACESTFAEFLEAVLADPEASRRAERGLDRFARTLEILFGADSRDLRSKLRSLGWR